MKFRFLFLFAVLFLSGNLVSVTAQADSLIGQITTSISESFASGISGDGRFVVIESTGNIATENPRNADGNREIFLFDYAQRRIFQITDTKHLLINPANAPTFDNIKVEIVNSRPVISNNGRWIAFGSNATCAYPGNPTANPPLPPIVSTTNPGSFDPNTTATSFPCNVAGPNNTTTSNLVNDGNTEMWLYQIPAVPAADLSSGDEVPFIDLSAGTFTRATNTLPSRLPVAGTGTTLPVIGDDNRDASISDNGSVIAFISNRDLVPCPTTPSPTCGNQFPNFDNPEVYTFVRSSGTIGQVTATPRGTIIAPIYNVNPTISGNGLRVAFLSNGNNPIVGMTGGNNTDRTDEIFYAELDSTGNPAAAGIKRQVTQTTATNPGDVINILSYGPRMSRDGRFIAFESFADLQNNGSNQSSSAVFVYDANTPVTTPPTNAFRQVGPRANADPGAAQGDVLRFPTFTDYNASGTPATLVLATRLNITPLGVIPSNASEGLNPDTARPTQVYTYELSQPSATARFRRLTKLVSEGLIVSTQPYASNSQSRISMSLSQVEPGTGNFDFQTESFYLLTPPVTATTAANLNFATGASAIPVSPSPVPTPSPTATPTPSPSPSPSPTPQTPPAVHGLAPGMLAIVNIDTGFTQPLTPKTAVGDVNRRFPLPIELSGVSMSIGGAAAGLKMVSRRQIVFVVPQGVFPPSGNEVSLPVVINNNGVVVRSTVTIVNARPDIFTNLPVPGPGGRARAQNVTNRVPTNEPFTVTTVRIRGGVRVATVLRLYATGIFIPNQAAATYNVRIGNVTIPVSSAQVVEREPGVYSLDLPLPASLDAAGDQPVVLTVVVGGITFTSRLDDTAPRLRIL